LIKGCILVYIRTINLFIEKGMSKGIEEIVVFEGVRREGGQGKRPVGTER